MKLIHAVHIEPLAASDGGGYLAIVPDLPGCMSDGETPEEALRNVQEAIASWLEVEKEDKFRVLKGEIEKGLADIDAGRVREWNYEEFLQRGRLLTDSKDDK